MAPSRSGRFGGRSHGQGRRASELRQAARLAGRATRDVAGAEDALSEAFAAALVDWPATGVPRTPEAWLLTVARRKWLDAHRRRHTAEESAPMVALLQAEHATTPEDPLEIPDERLRLMFACAHPALDAAVRAPLILQTILGFDAATIANAFLVAPATMGQRLRRAKQRIKNAGIPFCIPERAELPERLVAVLDAIYAIYTEGWSDPAGTEARRRGLADEALWLGRLVISLLPDEPEALGLLSLMLHADARRTARRDAEGRFVPLDQQEPAHWDAQQIEEAEALLLAASRLNRFGRYQIEAAIQSAHAARRLTGVTDWPAIVQLYDGLIALTGSVVAAVNRAVAAAEVEGAEAGLAALDALAADARLAEYQPYWAARAALLLEAGRIAEADAALGRAIGLATDPVVIEFLRRRSHRE